MSNYGRNQSGATPILEAGARRGQLASRNASTFNPISFNPEPQGNIEDNERLQKKSKQAAYRDQLDQMVANTRGQREAAEEYVQMPQREVAYDPERERREAEQRYLDPSNENQRRAEDEAFLQEQYRKMAEYERYQQQMDEMEKNYKMGNLNQNRNEDYGRPPVQEDRQPHQYQTEGGRADGGSRQSHPYQPEVGRAQQKTQEQESTFNQQDYQRELLLNRIKSGYSQQNSNVFSSYQRAHDERERNKQEFEKNLINKATQDRQKEEVRAMTEWERKKRMQQEASDANRRAAESRMLEKKKTKMEDALTENQRNQDSLSQFERDAYRQKETQKRLKEEANRVLEQQVRESQMRKLNKDDNVTQFAHPAKNNSDPYPRSYNQRSPLMPSNAKINQGSLGESEALGQLSSQMDQLSMKGPYGRDEGYGYGYQQNQYQQQQNPVQRDPYANDDYGQGYKQNQYQQQQYGGDLGGQNRYQEPQQARPNLQNASEYQKNRMKNRNTGYNIITNNNT